MRVIPVVVAVLGTVLMAVPILGQSTGLFTDAGKPMATGSGRDRPGGAADAGAFGQALTAAVAAAGDAFAALTGGGMVGVEGTGTGSDASQSLLVACKLAAAQGGMSEADCKAQLGPLAAPGGIAAMMKEAGLAIGSGAGGAVAPPAALAPRVSPKAGNGTRGGAKFVKVAK